MLLAIICLFVFIWRRVYHHNDLTLNLTLSHNTEVKRAPSFIEKPEVEETPEGNEKMFLCFVLLGSNNLKYQAAVHFEKSILFSLAAKKFYSRSTNQIVLYLFFFYFKKELRPHSAQRWMDSPSPLLPGTRDGSRSKLKGDSPSAMTKTQKRASWQLKTPRLQMLESIPATSRTLLESKVLQSVLKWQRGR